MNRRPFDIRAIEVVLGDERIEVADLNPEFSKVVEKTGIKSVFRSTRDAVDLAISAAKQLIDGHVIRRDEIKGLIVVSQSPRYFLPGISSLVHSEMKLPSSCISIDISQGCSGFVQALVVANGFIDRGSSVLLICTDTYRAKLNVNDRSTSTIFSDAASAALISADPNIRILHEEHYSEGSGYKYLFQKADDRENNGHLYMAGSDVFIFTKRVVARQIRNVIRHSGLVPAEIDCVYPHQASLLVLKELRNSLGDFSKVCISVGDYGNLVSSSIPMLLRDQLAALRTQRSVLTGFGVGLSCSTVLLGPNE